MTRPVIGIVGNSHMISDTYQVYGAGGMTCQAVAEVSGGLPLMVPTDPAILCLYALAETCDGFVLTGGRPNVHPEEYGDTATEAHGAFDRDRDRVALDLIRGCVARGQPIFGICPGFPEVVEAFESSLHPDVRDMPGRGHHRRPPGWSLQQPTQNRPCQTPLRWWACRLQ